MIKERIIDIAVFLLAFLLAYSIGAYITYQSNLVKLHNHDRYMLNTLNTLARDIKKRLDRSLDAAFFLKNEIELHGPDNLTETFDSYAAALIRKIDGITNLQLAPNGIISQIHPLEGHEAALGHSFTDNDPRHNFDWDADIDYQLIIIGPFNLIQGGVGIVASAPVTTTQKGEIKPWGFVSVLMLMDDFINATQLSEITANGLGYDISVSDKLTGETHQFRSSNFPKLSDDIHQKVIQIQNSNWNIAIADTKAYNPYGWIGFLVSFIVAVAFSAVSLWSFKQPEKLRKTVAKRTEELNRQKNFQADLLESIPMSLVVTNSSGQMLFSNQQFLSSKLNGFSTKEPRLITETSNQKFNNNARKHLALERNIRELLFELDRGHFIELTLLKIKTKDHQNLDTYLWAIRDVSALQEMNEALHELSSLRANIFELIPDGLAYFDSTGGIKSFNTNFLHQVTSLTQKGMTTSCSDIENRLQNHAIVDGPIVDYVDLQNNRFDENTDCRVTQTLFSLTPTKKLYKKVVRFDSSNGCTGGLILIRDITEQAKVEQMKSEILSTAAHELRTPMANIFGYLELVLNKKIPIDQQHAMLKIVYEEAERLSYILDDLLDLARIESRLSSSLNYEQHDLRQLIDETLGSHSEYARERQLKLDIAEDIQPFMCDAKKIKQVLHNLLSNAEKYSDSKTSITLSAKTFTRDYEEGILITVADQGIGMHPHEVDRVFERFYRANENSDRPGTGLGMAIVKQVIELHRGEINIESVFGNGTVVSVWLPLGRRS